MPFSFSYQVGIPSNSNYKPTPQRPPNLQNYPYKHYALFLPSIIPHFFPFFVTTFFAATFFFGAPTLFGLTVLAGAFFNVTLVVTAFFPGDVLDEVLRALTGLSLAFGFAGVALGFAAAVLALAGAAFGFALAVAFGLAAAAFGLGFGLGLASALDFAGDLAVDLVDLVSLALGAAGLDLAFGLAAAVAGFFLAGEAAAGLAGADDLADGSLKDPLTLTILPAVTSFFKWNNRSFLKFDGSCLCFSSRNLVIAYWLEPVFSFNVTIASLTIYENQKK